MSFWNDLSSPVKTYLVIAGVLTVLAIGFKSCATTETQLPRSSRGYSGSH